MTRGRKHQGWRGFPSVPIGGGSPQTIWCGPPERAFVFISGAAGLRAPPPHAGQTSTDSERPSGGRAFGPDGFDFNSTALRPRARVPLHQASVSRSVTWAEELRSLLKSVGQSGNQVMYCTHKEEPFWTERLRKRKEICPGQ